eukprot:2140780-Amphidinium_carterae.1
MENKSLGHLQSELRNAKMVGKDTRRDKVYVDPEQESGELPLDACRRIMKKLDIEADERGYQ